MEVWSVINSGFLHFSHFEFHGIWQPSSQRRHNSTFLWICIEKKQQEGDDLVWRSGMHLLSGYCGLRPPTRCPAPQPLASDENMHPIPEASFPLRVVVEPEAGTVTFRADYSSRMLGEWSAVSERISGESEKDTTVELAFMLLSLFTFCLSFSVNYGQKKIEWLIWHWYIVNQSQPWMKINCF